VGMDQPRTSRGCTWRGMRRGDSPATSSPGRGTGNSRARNVDEGRKGERGRCAVVSSRVSSESAIRAPAHFFLPGGGGGPRPSLSFSLPISLFLSVATAATATRSLRNGTSSCAPTYPTTVACPAASLYQLKLPADDASHQSDTPLHPFESHKVADKVGVPSKRQSNNPE